MKLENAGAPVGAPRRIAGGLLTVAVGSLTFVPGAAVAAQEWQAVDSIRAAAESAARSAAGNGASIVIDAIGVDERLRLPACAVPLETSLAQPFANGRGTVAVVCSGSGHWRLFVPVRISQTVAVVVVRQGVQRGTVLTANDLVLEQRPSSGLPYEYLLRAEDAVGQTVRRTVPAGTVLVPAALERTPLVERGALVTLVSAGGPVLVKAQGVALAAAGVNERVRVRTASGRVVEGTVSPHGEVLIGS